MTDVETECTCGTDDDAHGLDHSSACEVYWKARERVTDFENFLVAIFSIKPFMSYDEELVDGRTFLMIDATGWVEGEQAQSTVRILNSGSE